MIDVAVSPAPVHPLRAKMITVMRVRQFSPRTEESYLHTISLLWAHYRRSPERLTCEDVVAFLEHCVTVRKLERSTINVYFQACRFLYEQVLRRDRVSFQLPRRSRPKTRPQILSPEECRRLINAPEHLKHRALLHMVYGSGLRVSEVIRLLPRHIESGRMMVFVQAGKGHKDRYTVLAKAALRVLREYWRAYRPPHWLFPGRLTSSPMSEATALRVYHQALERSGVRNVGGIHTLRHCFATHAMENGMDIYVLKRLLGHTSIQTTSRYMHVREERLRQVVSPVDVL
jgi:site-specific recombinase XerD